jgi:E3 ubiquitin-protein ligase HERC2
LPSLKALLWIFNRNMGTSEQDSSVQVPVIDQHLALCLLLELAIQRGSLCRILEMVILLLEIWQARNDVKLNNRSASFNAPLVRFLRRFENIGSGKSKLDKENDELYLTFPEKVS